MMYQGDVEREIRIKKALENQEKLKEIMEQIPDVENIDDLRYKLIKENIIPKEIVLELEVKLKTYRPTDDLNAYWIRCNLEDAFKDNKFIFMDYKLIEKTVNE